jgi:hypothetical protein
MTDVDIRDLHGIYDVGRNTGMVMVGTTREPPSTQSLSAIADIALVP